MSLVCWLPLDGSLRNLGIGNVVATYNNATVDNNGKIGKCYNFNAKYIYTNDFTISTTNWSIAAWIYPTTDSSSSHQWIVGMNTSTASDFLGFIAYYKNKFSVRIAGTTYQNSTTSALNNWYHVAVTYSNNTAKLYVNGVLSSTFTTVDPVAATKLFIGSRGVGAGYFYGKVNDVRIYDHTLSTEEVKEISQGLICHCKLDNLNFVDSSGYGNRGTWNGSTAAVLYNSSIRNSQSVQITDGLNGYITIPIYLNKDAVTMSVWIKSISGSAGTGNHHMPFEINESNYEMSIPTGGQLRNGFVINGTRYADTASNASVISDKKWHMITATYDGVAIKRYVDGELVSTREISGTLSGGSQTIYIGRYGTRTQYGNVDICESDLRLYCTALSADDIKSLYQASEKIDKDGNLYAYEFKENESINPTFRKNGVVGSYLLTEKLFNILDPNYYVEPDGSTWIRIAHHNNPATKLFASNNTFTTKVYTDEDRWFYGSLCNYISGSWELMVKQKFTSDGIESKFRWIQSVNPMDGSDEAYNQTKEASITKVTTSGYSSVSGFGGIWRINNNTYLCANNGTKAQGFGAIGSWMQWKSGIPGYATGNTAITTGYIDLYLRVDNHINNKTSIGKHGNNFIQTKELKEI